MKRGLFSVILAIAIMVAWGNLSVAEAQEIDTGWATDMGYVSGGGRVVNQDGDPYFDPSGDGFAVDIPDNCIATKLVGYDTDKYDEDRNHGWNVSWNGGSAILHSGNNEWTSIDVQIVGPNTISFDGGGDSHGANVWLECVVPQEPTPEEPTPIAPEPEPEQPASPEQPTPVAPQPQPTPTDRTMFCRMPNTLGLELGKYTMFNLPIVEVKAEGIEVTIVTNQPWQNGTYQIYGQNGLVAEFFMEVHRDDSGGITGITCRFPEAPIIPDVPILVQLSLASATRVESRIWMQGNATISLRGESNGYIFIRKAGDYTLNLDIQTVDASTVTTESVVNQQIGYAACDDTICGFHANAYPAIAQALEVGDEIIRDGKRYIVVEIKKTPYEQAEAKIGNKHAIVTCTANAEGKFIGNKIFILEPVG